MPNNPISSEKKSLHNNKYYVYISNKFYSTKGIIFALLLNYKCGEKLFMLILYYLIMPNNPHFFRKKVSTK